MVDNADEQFFEFTWTILNFSMCRHKLDECINSPKFTVQFLENSEWCLKLYPQGIGDATFVTCFLHRTQYGPEAVRVRYSISLGDDRSTASTCDVHQILRQNSTSVKFVRINRPRYLARVDAVFEEGDEERLKVKCRLWKSFDLPQIPLGQNQGEPAAPYPPVLGSAVTSVPTEWRRVSWHIENFPDLPTQHEIAIPVVSASASSPKLLVTLSWRDDEEVDKAEDVLHMEVREMPELAGKTFRLGCRIRLVDAKGKRHEVARGWYLFTTVRRNYLLWVSTYSDSVWNFELKRDRRFLCWKRDEYLRDGALVLECDFALSYAAVRSHLSASGYVHPEPERPVVPQETPGNGDGTHIGWREYILREFNDQTSVFKFFFMLFVFLIVISRIFKEN